MWRDFRPALVLAVAVGLWFPVANFSWFWTHEQTSYVLRTVEFANGLRHGRLYPRWCSDFYGGYGSPLFVFYGPVPYGLAAVLHATFLTPFLSLKIVALLGSICAGLGTYALVFGETRSRDAALLAALLFLASPYRITCFLVRGDFGEFLCLGILPVTLFLYRQAALQLPPLRARWFAVAASASHAITIMTHPILGLWGSSFIGLVVVVTAVQLLRRGARARAILILSALALAPALAGVYVLPAIAYRNLTHTAAMVIGWYDPQRQWILLRSLFEDNVPGTMMPSTIYRIGPIVVAAMSAVLIAAVRDARRGVASLGWLCLSLGLVALTMRDASWFWKPGRIPLATFIQFPWRLLGPASLFASVAVGVALPTVLWRVSDGLSTWVAIGVGAGYLLALAGPTVVAFAAPTAGIPSDPEAIRQGVYSATDANEYLPSRAPAPPAAPRPSLVVDSHNATVEFAHADDSRYAVGLRGAVQNAVVTLGLFSFPGWHIATDSGPTDARLDTDDAGRLRVTLPEPGAYRIRVWFGGSWATRVGALLSALAVMGLGGLLIRGRGIWPARSGWMALGRGSG